jgi:hypothetical protein
MIKELKARVISAEQKISEGKQALAILKGAGENVTTEARKLKDAETKLERLKSSMKKVTGE